MARPPASGAGRSLVRGNAGGNDLGGASGTIHVTNASDMASGPSDFTNANPGGLFVNHQVIRAMSCTMGWIVAIVGANLLTSRHDRDRLRRGRREVRAVRTKAPCLRASAPATFPGDDRY
jgi:hypothetical protein